MNRGTDVPKARKWVLLLILILVLILILCLGLGLGLGLGLTLALTLALTLVLLSQACHLGFELHQSPGLADTLVVGINDTDCIYSPAAAAGCWTDHVGIAAEFTLSAPRARLRLHFGR